MTFQTRSREALASLGASEISQSDRRSYSKLNRPLCRWRIPRIVVPPSPLPLDPTRSIATTVEKSLPDQNARGNCSEEMLVSTSGRLT
jgi:hypothetical protein